jgi:hypothetical protein
MAKREGKRQGCHLIAAVLVSPFATARHDAISVLFGTQTPEISRAQLVRSVGPGSTSGGGRKRPFLGDKSPIAASALAAMASRADRAGSSSSDARDVGLLRGSRCPRRTTDPNRIRPRAASAFGRHGGGCPSNATSPLVSPPRHNRMRTNRLSRPPLTPISSSVPVAALPAPIHGLIE